MRLYLVRHGQTIWNATNKAQGHCDVALNDLGLKQADRLVGRLAGLDIKRVMTSDLDRAINTAKPFVAGSDITIEAREDLRERTFGTMEGTDYTDLHFWMRSEAAKQGIPEYEIRPPEGESMTDGWNRLKPVERELREEDRNTLVVSHGGALAQLLTRLMRGTQETPRSFRFSNCGVTTLEKRPDGAFLLIGFNDVAHQEGLE